VPRAIAFTHANLDGKTRHQFVTKTRSFRDIFEMVRTGQAKQARGFSFLTTQLTRWRPAVRARTGLPHFSITSRLATAFRCCFAAWFASHLFLNIKDRLALVRSRAVASVTPYSPGKVLSPCCGRSTIPTVPSIPFSAPALQAGSRRFDLVHAGLWIGRADRRAFGR
jgi:hypothetical protein